MLTLNHNKTLSAGLLVLRVGIGCLMLVHGLAKLNGFGEMSESFPDPIGLGSKLSLVMAIGAEVGCSLLLIIGLATRLATLPLAFTMIVALFVVHGADPWKVKELAAMYLLVYVSLAATGPGIFSLDHVVAKKIRSGGKPTEESA
ncbi:Putative oxidoreductase CatD [Stieleria maiorica]|uniref:Oxidoreductase CatD n=1 Tax=Stieleria maiorica TaxID=2795974 RepID=A0A5B9MF52_9BACT|nr:DoxX family protein [Stieleria maiorica]QEF99149.1 Putative oxidoreductase CatD [Stieleria maiorica]